MAHHGTNDIGTQSSLELGHQALGDPVGHWLSVRRVSFRLSSPGFDHALGGLLRPLQASVGQLLVVGGQLEAGAGSQPSVVEYDDATASQLD